MSDDGERKVANRERKSPVQARHHVDESCQLAHNEHSLDVAECAPLFSAFTLLQEKWVLFIVHSLLGGPLGFNELSRRALGVNTTTLTQRLMLLEQHGVVKRTVNSMMPPRTTYELTAAGLALRAVIDAIERWGELYCKESDMCETDECQ